MIGFGASQGSAIWYGDGYTVRSNQESSSILVRDDALERTVLTRYPIPACSAQTQDSRLTDLLKMHPPHQSVFAQSFFGLEQELNGREHCTHSQPICPRSQGAGRHNEASTRDPQPYVSHNEPDRLATTLKLHCLQTAALAPGVAQSNYVPIMTSPKKLDWVRIRPIFEHLYVEKNKKLKEVMVELHQKHNFSATEQMYKTRIRQWGLEKNLKQHEVEHILGITAKRKATGKDTFFTLHGRKVDMQSVYRFQLHKKLGTSRAIANYATGQSKQCRDLRPLTPQNFDSPSWKTPDRPYENTLLAFCALFHGLVDTRYYWMESNEIVMPPSALRGEVSDICSNLVASKNSGLNFAVVRKLALLMESIVHSSDAWIHCRCIYMLWFISTAGNTSIAGALLAHLKRLVESTVDQKCAQYRFVQHYSSLEASRAMKLAADMISIKADMVEAFRVESPVAFRLRSLEYDVFWRRREQGNGMSLSGATDLLRRSNSILGPLAVETLAILRIVLEDSLAMQVELTNLRYLLDYLENTKKLAFCENPPVFTFNGQSVAMEAASELACIYCQVGLHDAEAWIFEKLLPHHTQTASCLRREYSLLVHISRCSELLQTSCGRAWLYRKHEIENIWQTEVEAAAPTNELLNHY